MYICCVYTATTCTCKKCQIQTQNGKNIGHFDCISYWTSTFWSMFDKCLFRFALHKVQGTRRHTSSRLECKGLCVFVDIFTQAVNALNCIIFYKQDLLFFVGKGCDEAITITFARYTPTGEVIAVKRADLENYPHDVSVLQVRVIMSED